ncbi:probable serine/threonine-protein kinase SIS8 isoform X1 [Zea mays]|uniref:non-specific serine/threonine protein kinase n=2 Tax=Zea mays TaxID=4577 RepID=A0A1D6QQC6_MAIZE|nr:probable serine/threonine-protein kinase SIS8 isoform X1 [Zea mays]AQK59738.1 Protein kinase domain superfamily protein [Zea mays]|eukprot:XP_008679833.1 probable serine/threonine-protein kinase SIS8 isoform X1 [Zea mays]
MSRMKHLLRKLHLAGGPAGAGAGGAAPDHHRSRHRRSGHPTPPPPGAAVAAPEPPQPAVTPAAAVSIAPAVEEPRGLEAEAATTRLEEDYQVRLALAISASDHAGLVDADSVQIRAAELISLGAGAGSGHDRSPAEALSARYWNHSVVNYDEQLPDGFYDVCGAQLHPGFQAKFPSLEYLRAVPLGRDAPFLAILVDREHDPALKRLEDRAAQIAAQTRAGHGGAASAELAQKIVGLIVNAMGGLVEDADGMNREWSIKSHELSLQLNSVVLPLGSLRVGLSRHRSLLFKVLADRVNLPCKLLKGICYTGTDEGAVNLVKVDFDSMEYIIDLMGAPGTLIPSDISGSQFQDSNNSQLSSDAIEESVAELCLALEQINGGYENKNTIGGCSSGHSSILALTSSHLGDLSQTELKQNVVSEKKNDGDISEHVKVDDVSKYIVPEVVDPQFAQNLHDLLLESGALLPSDLLSDQNNHDIHEKESTGWLLVAQTTQNLPNAFVAKDSSSPDEDEQPRAENTEAAIRDLDLHGHTASVISNEDQMVAGSLVNMSGSSNGNLDTLSWSSVKTISSVIDDIAEYEIPWEDLDIGERIGLGSFGEVYRADWNGTEVAVKKFLDQDLSGVSLEQFKCEVRIMSRLRHPNVVLFLGYVTQSPNLSILTEYLPRGSLYRLLHRPNSRIDEVRRLKMAFDVAKGMNYLHSSHPTIVHRDLKSPNLLVDKNWVVKVSDFGMSRLKHHTFLSSKSTAGTPEWMAPEVLRNEPSNEKCDVYSFGVILWELATMRVPWSGLNPMQVVGAVGFQNRRLEIPKDVDPQVASIISSCWDSDPSKRPSFSQLLSPLKQLQHLVVTESC